MAQLIKAFWSRRDIAAAKGTSISTEKREQKTDPEYPRLVWLSPSRVGFADDDVQRYFEVLRSRYVDDLDEDDPGTEHEAEAAAAP